MRRCEIGLDGDVDCLQHAYEEWIVGIGKEEEMEGLKVAAK